jgi:hypothetical protein
METKRAVPTDGWGLLDHQCSVCASRLIQHETGMVCCSCCERTASSHQGLCMCGLVVDGKRGRYQCAINQAPRPGDDSRIVATLHRTARVSKRGVPIKKRPLVSGDLPRSGPEPVNWWAS